MPEVLLSTRSIPASKLQQQCAVDPARIAGLPARGGQLVPNRPYLVSSRSSTRDAAVMGALRGASAVDVRNLVELSLAFEADTTVALAEMMGRLRTAQVELLNSSAGVYSNRISAFMGAVQQYQYALLRYRSAIKMGSSAAARRVARQHAQAAFEEMQGKFRLELAAVRAKVRASRGLPLTNPQRAINIATSSRTAAKLNVSSQAEAQNLVRFSRYARLLGSGLAVIDFGTRAGRIHTEYQTGGDWEREMFVESTSFALSASAGTLTAKAGTAGLGFLVMATPVGWVGLLIGGAVVATATAGVTIATNQAIRGEAGSWYDSIMAAVSGLWN